jgi:hypothetical protein
MPFALLADEFHSDPKTIKAGLAGAGLYARALSYCGHYVTDGFVPLAWASEVAGAAVRRKVTDAGFWVEVVGGETYHYISGDETYTVTITEKGFFIPDYLAYNPTRKSVLEKRSELSQKRSEAGKKGAAARWQRTRQSDGNGDGKAIASVKQTDSPLPLPQQQDQEQDLDLNQEQGNGEPAAAEPPISESEFRTTLARMPGADETVIQPLAERLPRSVFLDTFEDVLRRKKTRNPAGLLVTLLEKRIRAADRAARLAEAERIPEQPRPEPILRLPPAEAVLVNVRTMAANGHSWERVEEFVRSTFGPEHIDQAHAAYDQERTAA